MEGGEQKVRVDNLEDKTALQKLAGPSPKINSSFVLINFCAFIYN